MSQPPYPGPPYPDDPTSGRPPQGQPPYQPPYPGAPEPPPGYPYGQPTQPMYGAQPGYGYGGGHGGHGGYGAPQPPKKSRTLPIVLVSVAIVLVLCVGGGVALVLIGKNESEKDDRAAGQASSAPKSASTVTITEPATLGGRAKLTAPQFEGLAEQLESGLGSVPDATKSIGALYGDVAAQDIVILSAAEAPVRDPEGRVESTFHSAGLGGLKIDNITTASTGNLGGAAKCGSAASSGIDMAVCTWADEGSVGMFIWIDEPLTTAKAEFPKLRAQVEKK